MRTHIRAFILLLLFILTACAFNRSRLNASSCEEPGRIGSDRVSNPTQGFEISFQYYLPPCYEKQTNARFPVIYLITMPFESGLNANANTPLSLADRLIHEGRMPPAILIAPNDIVAIGYEAALATDLIPYVDKKFKTLNDRRYRGVGGISHGGAEAARMAFQFPDLFGSLGILSGGIASQEKETFDHWIASASAETLPRVRIDIGDEDGIMPLTQNLIAVLDRAQVPYTLNIGEGDHNWTFWSPLMESYLLWFAEAWE